MCVADPKMVICLCVVCQCVCMFVLIAESTGCARVHHPRKYINCTVKCSAFLFGIFFPSQFQLVSMTDAWGVNPWIIVVCSHDINRRESLCRPFV